MLHLHRGTPYVYQGEELGMTNAPFASIGEYRDIESLRHHAQALEAGVPVETVMAALALKGRDDARPPCSGMPARTPVSPPASHGSR